jgi:hypothetical protein
MANPSHAPSQMGANPPIANFPSPKCKLLSSFFPPVEWVLAGVSKPCSLLAVIFPSQKILAGFSQHEVSDVQILYIPFFSRRILVQLRPVPG